MTTYSTDPAAALTAILGSGYAAIDIETSPKPEYAHLDKSALHPCTGLIGMVILESGGKVFLLREVPSWMGLILEDPTTKKIGFNLKFDLMYLFAATGVTYARNVADGYLKEMLVSPRNRGMSHSLQATLKRRLAVTIEKGGGKDEGGVPFAARVDWLGEWTPEMIEYATEDISYLAPLDAELDRLLESTGQVRAAQIENDAVSSIAAMTLHGMGIDRPAWEQAIPRWVAAKDSALERLDTDFGGSVNWNSWQQIIKAVDAKCGIKLPNTKKSTVEDMAPMIPELKHLVEYKKYQKLLGTWGESFFEKFLCAACARVHPAIWQLGADTGRMSYSEPNLQQIPRGPEFRALFRAKPDHLIVACDYSQIEIVTAAIIAGDVEMLTLLRRGEDIHRAVGAIVLGTTPDRVTKDERTLAKAVNFGLLFGGGAGGLQAYAHTSYGVEMSEAQARVIIAEYFATFTDLKQLRNEAYREVDRAKAEGRFLTVRNLVGMRRILSTEKGSLKPTTFLNTRIQSSAAYGLKAALRKLGERGLNQYVVAVVHDEIVLEVPIALADDIGAQTRDTMIAGMKTVLGKYAPVVVDVEMDETWSATWLCPSCGGENTRKAVLRSPCVKCGVTYREFR
jgi:DNA polymerase-1